MLLNVLGRSKRADVGSQSSTVLNHAAGDAALVIYRYRFGTFILFMVTNLPFPPIIIVVCHSYHHRTLQINCRLLFGLVSHFQHNIVFTSSIGGKHLSFSLLNKERHTRT